MQKKSRQLLLTATLFFVAVFLFFAQRSFSQNVNYVKVSFLDVGQGDAIFIEAPNGVQVLVDGGPGDAVQRQLPEVMRFWDRSIDILVATHPDADHIGGLPEVLRRYRVDYVLDTEIGSDTGVYDEYTYQRDRSRAERIQAQAGGVIVLDRERGVFIEVLFPGKNIIDVSDKNDTSIVLRLVYGESEVLLTGDASTKIEKYLVSKYGKNLESDILKLGHHGSKTSTSEEFLQVVSPSSVVISAGKDNRYGHPHQEVIRGVQDFGSNIYSTNEADAVRFMMRADSILFQSR